MGVLPTLLIVCSHFAIGFKVSNFRPQQRMLINKFAAENSIPADAQPIYCLNVNVFVKPERRSDFLKCIRENQKGTVTTERLNKQYVWGESVNEPNTFHFHEEFYGREGFEAHTRTPHFTEWRKFVDTDPFTKDPELVFYELK